MSKTNTAATAAASSNASTRGTGSSIGGTESPPLEATTGQAEPMGASSVDNPEVGAKAGYVNDAEQRKQYFPGYNQDETAANETGKSGDTKREARAAGETRGEPRAQKMMGESLADKFDNAT